MKISNWMKEKESELFQTIQGMKKQQMQFGVNGMIGIVVIDDDGEISTHWLSTSTDTLRGIFEGYMYVVAKVPVDDISSWYEDGGIPHHQDLSNEEKQEIIELCWLDNKETIEESTWDELHQAIQERQDDECDQEEHLVKW